MASAWRRDFAALSLFVFGALIVFVGLLSLAVFQILALVVGKAHTSRITSCTLASCRAGKIGSTVTELLQHKPR